MELNPIYVYIHKYIEFKNSECARMRDATVVTFAWSENLCDSPSF